MANPKEILLWSGAVMELAGVLLITKATATASSPVLGIVMLGIGLLIVSMKWQQKQAIAPHKQAENLSASTNAEVFPQIEETSRSVTVDQLGSASVREIN